MSLLTEMMRSGAERTVTAVKGDDALWRGIELVNHPTPSGCERWLPTYSDKRGWNSSAKAIKEFKRLLKEQLTTASRRGDEDARCAKAR
jgi:hypothetical protein